MADRRRLLVGTVTARSARLRLDGWPSPPCPVRLTPPHGTLCRFDVADRPAPVTTWVVDFANLVPDTHYVADLGPFGGSTVGFRTAPAGLDAHTSFGLSLLSCYFPSDQFVGRAGRVLGRLAARSSPPHLNVLCGDQIYADVPSDWTRDDPTLVYARRYEAAWAPGRLGPLLAGGANVFACDDHEYWNNYPETTIWLSRSWWSWAQWADAARAANWGEQGQWNFAPGITGGAAEKRAWCAWRQADVDLFVADTRTDRASPDHSRCPTVPDGECPHRLRRSHLMTAAQRHALHAWIASVPRLGILVLGQPILAAATSWSDFDTTLADYDDYDDLIASLRWAIATRGVSFIVLSGDIHWSRLVRWRCRTASRPDAMLIEFVTSPLARVGLPSIVSTRADVGRRADPKLDGAARGALLRRLPHFDEGTIFATNEHAIGFLTIRRAGHELLAEFEVESLDTQRVADDRWSGGRWPCRATLVV
ncbi:MAG: alkaline phosphatase D family protein [bacterium]|nr:alkaline phosphatase D family protein [bacterium]